MTLLGLLFFLGFAQTISLDAEESPAHKSVSTIQKRQNSPENLKPCSPGPFKPEFKTDSLTYTATKKLIGSLKSRLRKELKEKSIDIDSVKRTFGNRLINQIIPYWYGTSWSFGGHSSVPKKGEIACGYFISTTLKDMGVKLNRYKLAQKSPFDEARAISCGTKIKTISHENPEHALSEIEKSVRKGVYFIGFDTGHVGFLVKKNEGLYLIHSNYLQPVSVCIEPLSTAKVFREFTKFHLVAISENDLFIKKWLNDEVVL